MKKLTLLITTLVAAAALPVFGDANFIFTDSTGDAFGSYAPGSTITFDITLNYEIIPPDPSAAGVSYWLESKEGGVVVSGIFAVTGRSFTNGSQTSPWTDPQTLGIVFPQPLSPENADDLGASGTPVAPSSNDIFIARVTLSIAGSATPGSVYTIQNTIFPRANDAKGSVVFDTDGKSSANLPATLYTVTIIPEPTTWSLIAFGGLGSLGLGLLRARRRS